MSSAIHTLLLHWPVVSPDSCFCFCVLVCFRFPQQPNKGLITRGRAAAAHPDPMSCAGGRPRTKLPTSRCKNTSPPRGFFRCVHTLHLSPSVSHKYLFEPRRSMVVCIPVSERKVPKSSRPLLMHFISNVPLSPSRPPLPHFSFFFYLPPSLPSVAWNRRDPRCAPLAAFLARRSECLDR